MDTKEIAFDILREMYSEAEPPLDFDDALENPDDYDDGWYDEHYLESERQKEILEKHCEKHDVTDNQHSQIAVTAILDLGPASTR